MTERERRDRRLLAIERELELIRRRLHELVAERSELQRANAREDWPAGPFTLRYWQHGTRLQDEYDTPEEALIMARGMEEIGSGAPEEIADSSGRTIYKLDGLDWKRVADGYLDVPEEDE